jgi:hypothetical protein
MIRSLATAALLLSLAGCSTYNNRGIFIVYLPSMDNYMCDTVINENFLDSDAPFDTYYGVSPWVYDTSVTSSPEVTFLQIFEDRSGNVIVDFGGAIYTGTVEKGVITVSWTNSETSQYSEQHATGGYTYTEAFDVNNTTTITLTPNKETKGFVGFASQSDTAASSYSEVDQWDQVSTYISAGSINWVVSSWLDGYGSNSWDSADCDATPCFVDITSSCNGTLGFEVAETDLPREAFDNVEGDGQPAGAGGYGGYVPYYGGSTSWN